MEENISLGEKICKNSSDFGTSDSLTSAATSIATDDKIPTPSNSNGADLTEKPCPTIPAQAVASPSIIDDGASKDNSINTKPEDLEKISLGKESQQSEHTNDNILRPVENISNSEQSTVPVADVLKDESEKFVPEIISENQVSDVTTSVKVNENSKLTEAVEKSEETSSLAKVDDVSEVPSTVESETLKDTNSEEMKSSEVIKSSNSENLETECTEKEGGSLDILAACVQVNEISDPIVEENSMTEANNVREKSEKCEKKISQNESKETEEPMDVDDIPEKMMKTESLVMADSTSIIEKCDVEATKMTEDASKISAEKVESQVNTKSTNEETVMFMDDDSCDTVVLRKPEPVSQIREETLAGDPRFDSQDSMNAILPTKSGVREQSNACKANENSDSIAGGNTNDGASNQADMSIKDDGDQSEEDQKDEEEDEQTVKRTKRKKKPRRSIFAKPKKQKKDKDESAAASPVPNLDEDSQGSTTTKEKKEPRRFRCEVVVPESTEVFTAEKVIEYVWPLEGGYGEHYFIQEHISQYICISSFKRKYPDMRRRAIDMAEKDYLKELGLVSEISCDLGLTAVRSEDVMDVLFNDFPAKYEELSALLNDRREKQLKERGKVDYQVADIDKSKMQEYGRRAAEEAARWNAALNREKREERLFSFDLQTFTCHQPQSRGRKMPTKYTKVGHYPVAVLPGQFCDNYRRYTSEELFRLPLNSVKASEVVEEKKPVILKVESLASKTAATATIISNLENKIKLEDPMKEVKILRCKVCFGGKDKNKSGKPEGLIVCAKCSSSSHASCVDLNPDMIPRINSYGWQCMDCKNCMQCKNTDDEEKMIFCDMCDRGFHIYCVGLRRVPQGRWHCKECAVCDSCGCKSPGGYDGGAKNPDWQHEFKKNKDNRKICYATTLCVPCDRLWKKRQFCYVCLKVYKSIAEDKMVRCTNCPKLVHKDKVECSALLLGEIVCSPCFKSNNSTVLNHNRIVAAAKRKMASGF